MSNFFWTTDGKYIKKDIIEHLSNGFTINENNLCIDDVCISKDELVLLKQKVTEYSIFDTINKKDILTNEELKIYMKEVFKKIYSSENKKIANIEKYLAYGIYNNRLGEVIKLSSKYKDLDFLKLYYDVDDFIFNKTAFSQNEIEHLISNNFYIHPIDSRKNFVLQNGNNIAVSPEYYYVFINNILFSIYKIKADNYIWKILISIDSIIEEISNEFDNLYVETYTTNFENINSLNSKDEITKIELVNLLDDYRIISIMKGEYDFDVFKDNLFIKQFNNPLILNNITEELIDLNIYNIENLQLTELNDDQVIELKIKMSLFDLKKKYYVLISSDVFNIYLLNVKYNEDTAYKWQILYLEETKIL
tara:strand:+ start:1141 stop:2229 length:1089 start_codon:yes stop_codon:yes gene_type:complete